MHHDMSQTTKNQVLSQLRRRYVVAGREHKRKLLIQAVELLGYHRKAAIRALRARPKAPIQSSCLNPGLETVLKFMIVEKSGESAELDPDHGNIDERLGTGDSLFVVAHQSAVMQQPAEGALDAPATGQHFKPAHIIRAFDDLDGQVAAAGLHSIGKRAASVAAIHPQEAEPNQPPQHSAQDRFGAVTSPPDCASYSCNAMRAAPKAAGSRWWTRRTAKPNWRSC